jgi:transcriptional regulator with XRE-family HTH domain
MKKVRINRYRWIREEFLGLSQHELADVIGIHQSRISRWEAGLVPPSASAIQAIRDFAIVEHPREWSDSFLFMDPPPTEDHRRGRPRGHGRPRHQQAA